MSFVNSELELLSEENYETWKFQMEALLIRNDLWGYVNGKISKPIVIRNRDGTIGNASDIEFWEKQDRLALAEITLSIVPSKLRLIKNCKTSGEAWEKLQKDFETRRPALTRNYLKQLILIKMKETDDVNEYLEKFGNIVDKLNELDMSIDETFLSIILLYSLPPSFEKFQIFIEAEDEIPKVEQLKKKIVEASAYRKKEKSQSKNNLYVEKNFDKPKIKCYKCNKFGHKANNCVF